VPEPEQVIRERRRQVSPLAEFAHAGRAMPLGEWRTIRTHEQRKVTVSRRPEIQRFEHEQLTRRVGEMVLAAQHVGDTHLGIVDGVAEEERRAAVGTPQDEIADVVARETLGTVHHVVELDDAPRGNAKARRGRYPLGALAHTRLGRKFATRARVPRRAAGGELRLAGQVELERRAITRVREATGIERRGMPGVDRATAGLMVFLARRRAPRTLVPRKAEPFEVFHQRCGEWLLAALGIGIFDAQHELPAVMVREQPAEQRRARVSEMQRARGAGGETGDDGTWGHGRILAVPRTKAVGASQLR
jgi:hypothetical protein